MTSPSLSSGSVVLGERIRVRGLVQGVGFRPAVWRLARECGLVGEVLNDGEGVLIHAWGDAAALGRFVARLHREPPPLARIDAIERDPVTGPPGAGAGFHIVDSQYGSAHTGVVPDAGVCKACVEETLKPGRRYRYAFTNCTHCGPRLSIVRAIPYDRANTSMATFAMCPQCRGEYQAPADRRFHAQPIACPVCGPQVWLEDGAGRVMTPPDAEDAVALAARWLSEGKILAVKGIGGFHLACDATHGQAVAELRRRKRRYGKPLALMARDLDMIRRYCAVSSDEEELLRQPAAPIVLLETGAEERVAEAVAPGQHTLGFMLPYTPLHHLLMRDLERPIVLTSGNLSHEPQCIDNDDARERLGGMSDVLLLHDRDIVNRLDDSVARVVAGRPRFLRRARGCAPAPLPLPPGFEGAPPLLALGGELKNTFCLVQDGQAVLSQHIGDLEDAATYTDYQRNLDLYLKLFQHVPARLVLDLHPEYLSTKHGRRWAERDGLAVDTVQHHHAHIASCLAEHGLPLESLPVLGIALDGLGFGVDGKLWGGEFLLADYRDFRRLGAFRPVAMLGGIQAIHQPWRNAYAHIAAFLGWSEYRRSFEQLELTRFLDGKPLRTLDAMNVQGINSPVASSCGRLFDAVAAAIGLCREQALYEGQAAMELEALVDEARLLGVAEPSGYPFAIDPDGGLLWLGFEPMWRALCEDLASAVPGSTVAARFHAGLARAVCDMVTRLSRPGDDRLFDTVVLSGGVFQNKLLLTLVDRQLQDLNFKVLSHGAVPANDGGLALGQAAVAAARACAKGRAKARLATGST
jgi:hydrogenase maturation protein HypF